MRYKSDFRNGIFYVVFSLASWLAPLLVNRLGARNSLLLATLAYVFHISQYLYLNTVSVYIASVVIGVGAAILFSAQVCSWDRMQVLVLVKFNCFETGTQCILTALGSDSCG